MIKVSVIVPVYKVEKYILKCLDSILNQTLIDIEIIVVNDCTPDKSFEICKKYASNYKNMKLVEKDENTGLSDTRNVGLQEAIGEFISFIDSDDYIEENMLELLYEKAVNENLDIVVCDVKKVYENSDKQVVVKSFLSPVFESEEFIISPPMACNKLFRKKMFDEEFKFEKGLLYEDLDLIPSLILKAKKIGYVDIPLYNYLQRSGSIMYSNNFNEKLLDIFKVLDRVSNKFEKYNKYLNYEKEIEFLYISHLLRTATLRFLCYNDVDEYLVKINNIIKERYPSWNKNKYYLKSSYKMKLICKLAFNKRYKLLIFIKKIFDK